MSAPSSYDLDTARLISDYLVLGMHHSTPDGLEAIARIITERDRTIRVDAVSFANAMKSWSPEQREQARVRTAENVRKFLLQ